MLINCVVEITWKVQEMFVWPYEFSPCRSWIRAAEVRGSVVGLSD